MKKSNSSTKEYPCYISNHPRGVDMYEGKSQERLANVLVDHIIYADSSSEFVFPRLVGLEGKWGTGKSNVIKLLEERIKDSYIFFTFDTWGNQEDLQRRSILELLTKYLIDNHKLVGKTKIRVMSPDKEGVITKECSWEEKLESLLSRKSYTKNITVPSVNTSTKFFVLSLLITGLVISYLAVNKTCWWWLNILISFLPLLLFTLLMVIKRWRWTDMFAMYNTDSRSDTTSFVISEQEPSIREFKEWMTDLSEGIPKTDKIVLVSDNTDRLPQEKVHQFWSLIQTFFADDGYSNIWCIIPYDENHLAELFTKGEDKDNSVKILRGYLHKTFPVVYRVPDPIVSDYKLIFEKLYKDAFGTTVEDNIIDIISLCYRRVCPEPNVSEIITFINRNVKIAKQWKDLINPISITIYALMSDSIIRNPQLTDNTTKENRLKSVTTEEYILSNDYLTDFSQILFDKINAATIRRDIAAIVYGVEPELAYQIMVKRYIRNCIIGKSNRDRLAAYSNTPHFMLLLWEEINSMELSDYKKGVPFVAEVNGFHLSQEDSSILERIWSLFASRYSSSMSQVNEFSEYEKTIISHIKEEEKGRFAMTFCQRLIENQEINGAIIYYQLSLLFDDLSAKNLEPRKICPEMSLEPKRFAEYVIKAGKDYKRFPLNANNEALNDFLIKSIGKDYPYLSVLNVLKEDDCYSVSEVADYAVEHLNKNNSDLTIAYNYIRIQRVFYSKIQSTLHPKYINSLWLEAQKEKGSFAYQEIYALKAVNSFEQLAEDDDHISILLEKSMFYTTTVEILQNYLRDKNVHFRKRLVTKIINSNVHDSLPNYPQFIEHWHAFVDSNISREALVRFSDNWGLQEIPKNAQNKEYFSLLAEVNWIDVFITEKTPLSKQLLDKCVNELITQGIVQFVQINTVNHSNTKWDKVLTKLVPTEYISPDNFGSLNDLAAYFIDYIARIGVIKDLTWETLLNRVKSTYISTQLNDIRIKILTNQNGYAMTPKKFIQLHRWLEKAEINNNVHCTDSANLILAKVVNDEECRKIIENNGEYYRPIIVNTVETASVLHKRLREIVKTEMDSVFANYIKSIVTYQDS